MAILLEKLQSATAGSRELSDECLMAWGWKLKNDWNGQFWWLDDVKYSYAPHVTADLQHAVEAAGDRWRDRLGEALDTLYEQQASGLARYIILVCLAIEKARKA